MSIRFNETEHLFAFVHSITRLFGFLSHAKKKALSCSATFCEKIKKHFFVFHRKREIHDTMGRSYPIPVLIYHKMAYQNRPSSQAGFIGAPVRCFRPSEYHGLSAKGEDCLSIFVRSRYAKIDRLCKVIDLYFRVCYTECGR